MTIRIGWLDPGISPSSPAARREVVSRIADAGMDGIKVVSEGNLLPPNWETGGLGGAWLLVDKGPLAGTPGPVDTEWTPAPE